MTTMLVLPLLIPLLTAALCLVGWRHPVFQRWAGTAGAAAELGAALVLLSRASAQELLVLQVGSWPAPFGITLAADLFGALMLVLAGCVGLGVAVYSLADIPDEARSRGFYPIFHVLLAGVSGAFLTGDLFNLYVWFEVMLTASFVLLALGGGRRQMEGAIKYVGLNLLCSAMFLAATGLIYGATGTLNMADLHESAARIASTHPNLLIAVQSLLFVGFGIKAAIFPLYFWLPASYPTPPSAIGALFAGLLTKVGLYALIRTATIVFPHESPVLGWIPALAAWTMIVGVLGAVAQQTISRILSFHIVSQIGYMIMGVGMMTSSDPSIRHLGLQAAVFYIAHHIVVKTNLFLVAGTVREMRGTDDLRRVGGLASASPPIAILFLIPALSLAGVPPLSGFWAKLAVIRAGLLAGQGWVVTAALATSLLTLVSMLKIWQECFWKPTDGPARSPSGTVPAALLGRNRRVRAISMCALAAITLWISVAPQPLMRFAGRSADQLLRPERYTRGVLSSPAPAVHDVVGREPER